MSAKKVWRFIKRSFLAIFAKKDEETGRYSISLARLLLLALFVLSLIKWKSGADIPDTLQTTLYIFLGYVFGSAMKELINRG